MDTAVAVDVWTTIDPEWIDLTIGPFACVCGAKVGMLDAQNEAVSCECGRTYALAVKVWRTDPAAHAAPKEDAR